jgi:hypothetical protein
MEKVTSEASSERAERSEQLSERSEDGMSKLITRALTRLHDARLHAGPCTCA